VQEMQDAQRIGRNTDECMVRDVRNSAVVEVRVEGMLFVVVLKPCEMQLKL
jgi:hypothetical protein